MSENKRQSSARLQQLLAERDGGWFCHYCHQPLVKDGRRDTYGRISSYQGPASPVVDHRTPRCRGGTDDLWNLVLSCHRCNMRKGTRSYLEVKWEGMGLGLGDPRPWTGRPGTLVRRRPA